MRAVLVLVCIVGCGGSGPSQETATTAPVAYPHYEPALDPVVAPSWTQALRAYVTEDCTTSGSTTNATNGWGDAPSSHEVNAGGGVVVRQGCGLVYFEVFTPQYVAAFARDVCSLPPDAKLDEPCSKRFIDMFFARLSERYDAADWSAVDQHCRAYPLDCNDSLKLERQLEARQQEIEEQRSAERRRAFFQGISAMGAAMAPPPTINCTSNTLGSTTFTNCH
jgi:hypothetical protein